MPFRYNLQPLYIGLIILGLILTITLGALAWSRTIALFLPLPLWLPITTTFLPIVSFILPTLTRRTFTTTPRNNTTSRITPYLPFLTHLHTLLATILATVTLTTLFPATLLLCRLESQWQSYYRAKNTLAIRTIQDSLHCCGLRSTRDRAWPFPDQTHGDDACLVQMGYRRACLAPWRHEEQMAAWMVVASVVVLYFVRIGAVRVFSQRGSWMSAFSERPFVERTDGRGYQAIAGPDGVHDEEDVGERETLGALLPEERLVYAAASEE